MAVGQISHDSVGWEKGSFWSLKQGQSVERGDGAEISCGLVGYLFYLESQSVDCSFNFSVPVIDCSFGAEVQFHDVVKIDKIDQKI